MPYLAASAIEWQWLGQARTLTFKFGLEPQYSVVRPDDLGTQWSIWFTVTPVIPPLIKDVLIKCERKGKERLQ